jgi:hypothetical protein
VDLGAGFDHLLRNLTGYVQVLYKWLVSLRHQKPNRDFYLTIFVRLGISNSLRFQGQMEKERKVLGGRDEVEIERDVPIECS